MDFWVKFESFLKRFCFRDVLSTGNIDMKGYSGVVLTMTNGPKAGGSNGSKSSSVIDSVFNGAASILNSLKKTE